jgi:GST-like protein
MKVFDGVLARSEFAAGDEFTIADVSHFGWLWRRQFADIELQAFPNVLRWYNTMAARPAVEKAVARVTALVPAA